LFQSTSILYDKKHLNDNGIKIFAKNLKSAFFGTQKTHCHIKTKPLFHPDPNKPFLPHPLLHSNPLLHPSPLLHPNPFPPPHFPKPYYNTRPFQNYDHHFPPMERNTSPNSQKISSEDVKNQKITEIAKLLYGLFQ
jgi:hypothetical protein